MNNRQERFSYTLNIFFKKIKFVFLPLFFFTFLLLPLDVFAISAEEAANKMNEYMLDAVVNGKWEVKTFEDNTSQYEITIDLDTSPSDFEEVKNNVPTELFSGSDYKASAQLFYCSDSSCSDWNQWSADGIIDFELKKNSDGNPYLYAYGIGPDTYQKVVNSTFHYVIRTNQKGFGGYIQIEGNASHDSSSNNVNVNRTVGTYANPILVGLDTTITIPNKDADIWNGQTDACYYFKVDFSAANSEDTTGRYKIDPVRDGYEFRWYQGGILRDFAFQDKNDTSLFGFANKNVYAICSVYDDNDYYGKTIHFTYQDSEAIAVNEYYVSDSDLVKEQLGDEYVIMPDDIISVPDADNWNKPIACEDLFAFDSEGSVGWILQTILNYIKVIGPIAVVLLSSIDFIRAIFSSDEKAMKEAQSKLIIRLVAALALFLIPTIVELLLNLINSEICIPK